MKNKYIRFISSLLVLSFLVAAFSVFSFAENTDETETEDPISDFFYVFFNRDYEDGWDWNNGFDVSTKNTFTGGNNLKIDYEEDMHGNYNYFTRFEVASDKEARASISFASQAVTDAMRQTHLGTVIELSIKADDLANVGNILYMTTVAKKTTYKLLDINAKGELIAFAGREGGNRNLGVLGNEWINLSFIFDWTEEDLVCKLTYQSGIEAPVTEKLTMKYDVAGDVGISLMAFTIPALASRSNSKSAESKGMSYCIDNFKLYQGVRQPVDLGDNYGKAVDTLADKVINIQQGAHAKTKEKLLEEALAMKVGVDYALIKNVRYPLVSNADLESYNGAYGAPVKVDGNVLVPLQLILDYIGFPSYIHPDNLSFDITTGQSTTYITIGRDSATVDGERVELKVAPGYVENTACEDYLVLCIDDIEVLFPGWLTVYDDMGLIILYEDMTPENLDDNEPIVNRKDDLATMVNTMKKFVFDTVGGATVEEGYVNNGTKVFEDVKANSGLNHPYIIADADTFAKLKGAYSTGSDAKLKGYIGDILANADSIYQRYASVVGGEYSALNSNNAPKRPGTSDGYDEQGEMTDLVNFTANLPILAFAYQITGNEDYAKLAYDMTGYAMGYDHWGPGYAAHFAEISSSVALAYDWLYNAYVELYSETAVADIAEAIYDLGVHDAYISSSGKTCEHGRGLGDLSVYNTRTDSTNAIATSGMLISALSILDYVADENTAASVINEVLYVIGNNIQSLIQYGLDIYAPDGSYIESPAFWEKATSRFFRMVMALESSAGCDYGFMDSWAMERTCYYAVHIESSDGKIWNYHDSDEFAVINTDMFFFAGAYYGDVALIAVRADQLEQGREVSIYDLFFYPYDGAVARPDFELDYYMEAIDGFVARSDWNSGAIYTGLMGGANNADHGQLDSGNFIYHNKGVTWIMDLGGENQYLAGIKDPATRYRYYRNSAEGQNVIFNADDSLVPYGQNVNAGGEITKTFTNEHGSYAILDNTAVHKNYSNSGEVSKAHRGVLLTNDRSTAVLQDEFAFVKLGSMKWVLHTKSLVTLDSSGRVAYLTSSNADGEKYTLRVSIVSRRPDFAFKVETATKSLLPAVSSPSSGEGSRNNISRLVIEANEIISFELAVVFEIVENNKDTSPVTYSWTYMNEWEPSEYIPEKVEQSANVRGTAQREDIVGTVDTAKSILERKSAYTDKLFDLYRALTDSKYIINACSSDFSGNQVTARVDYQSCAKDYEKFADFINGIGESAGSISTSLMGVMVESDE